MTPQEAISLSRLPQIGLLVLEYPLELETGLSEIQRHHIHSQLLKIGHRSTTPNASNASTTPQRWFWRLHFHDVLSEASLPGWSCRAEPTDLISAADFGGSGQQIIHIEYPKARTHLAYRALGHLLSVAKHYVTLAPTDKDFSLPQSSVEALYSLLNTSQNVQFETIGTMIDCSRNGVLKVLSVKYLLTRLALLGYNMLQLYTEDTYQIENEPFFGYMRGPYTPDELRDIDQFANSLGIEVIPCIQTLGHLGQMLQWPRYLGLRDTAEILLAEAPETYEMLARMIKAASAPFRSQKIHLGMDETHGLAHGRYYSIFGQHNGKTPGQFFAQHLAKVTETCHTMQLEPMIWSDMLFCLSARDNSLTGYYESDRPVEVDVKNAGGIPSGVDLVYWDYYHTQASSYRARIKSHEQLRGSSPWVASGSWTWSRFWTALPFTFQTTAANLEAAKACPDVRHVMMTIWGDEGNEVDLWSCLPAWVFYAENAYSKTTVEAEDTSLKAQFDALIGGNWDDFVLASALDDTSHSGSSSSTVLDDKIRFAPNTSKWMLWQDPVHAFVEPTLVASGFDAEEHYRQLARKLSDRLVGVTMDTLNRQSQPRTVCDPEDQSQTKVLRVLQDNPFNARLELPRLIATTLSYKANLRRRLHETYVAQDWPNFRRLHKRLRRCRDSAERCWHYHRQMWMSMYKPHGWETLELRYGGLVSRLDTLYCRMEAFLRHIARGGEVGVSLRTQTSTVFLPAMRTGHTEISSSADSSTEEDDEHPTSSMQDDASSDSIPQRPRQRHRATHRWQEEVHRLEELETPLQVVYASPDQLLDYHRVSRPTYC